MSSLFYGIPSMRAAMMSVRAEAAAESAQYKARDVQRDVRSLETELDRLELVLTALWSLLQEKLGVSEEELRDRVKEIDLSDGRLDGKVRRTTFTECPECNRRVSARNVRCLYCGAEIERSPL